jgi:hypothetical protein
MMRVAHPARLMILALAVTFGLSVAGQWWPGYVERVVSPQEIRAIGGHAYYVEPLGLTAPRLFEIRFDTNDAPQASGLALREDERPLGTAHAQHAAIGTEGLGAYSHWGNGLYFSSSDNSDPRTNGRRYLVRAPVAPGKSLLAALAVAFVVGLIWVTGRIVTKLATLPVLPRPSRGVAGEYRPRLDALPASIKVVAMAVALVVFAYYAYFSLLDPVGALASARRVAVKLTMSGAWIALGAVTAVWLQRRDRKWWRLGCVLLALFLTGWLLHLRVEVYTDNGIVPSAVSVIGPALAGLVAAYIVRIGSIQQRHAEFSAAPGARRRMLMGTIALVVCLAAPMIWSPVVEHWNSSGWMDSHSYDTYAHNIATGKVPEGSSLYMPIYQYGMAAVYFVFGHFFFAQQLVNVALSFLTVVFVCLAAWNLYRNLWAVLLIGIWAAFTRQLFYAVFFTQIEAWYIPIMAFGIFAWTSYWRTPSKSHLLLMALAAAVGMNTRNQGAFYFGWLCLAPLFIASIPWRRRVTHVAIAVMILAASLIPWSVRNYVVDGRLSPSAARNAYYIAALNDPRIGFYGVRYWEGWGEITQDYERRYPDPVERDRVMMRAGLSTPFQNSDWFLRAMFWRTLAFYGLLPAGVFAAKGPVPTNWATERDAYVYWRTTPLVLLPLSLIGLLTRPSRTTLFLAGAIAANVAVVAIAGGAEDRVSYPVLPLHMLMALAAIFPPQSEDARCNISNAAVGAARPLTWIAVAVCVLLFLVMARVQFGRANLYAPLVERDMFINANVELDQTLPSLNDYAAAAAPAPALDPTWADLSVRLRLIAFNYQCPPKYGGRIDYMPAFATDPARETYYYATLLVNRGQQLERLPIGVAWFGATVNERLREGDEVEAEGQLLLAPANPIARYWVRIEKARRVLVRSSEIPAFF